MEYKQRIKHIAEIIEEVKWENVDPDMLTRCVAFYIIVVLISLI